MTHSWELAAQALVVLFGSGEPHSIVGSPLAPVAQDEDNLVLNVECEAAEHGAGLGRQRSDRFEHELMRYGLALPGGGEGSVRRQQRRLATGYRHWTQDTWIPWTTRRLMASGRGVVCGVMSPALCRELSLPVINSVHAAYSRCAR